MNLIYSANKERGALDIVIDDPATYAVTVVPKYLLTALPRNLHLPFVTLYNLTGIKV